VRGRKGRLARHLEPPELQSGRPGTSSSLAGIGMRQGCSDCLLHPGVLGDLAELDRDSAELRDLKHVFENSQLVEDSLQPVGLTAVAQNLPAEANQVRWEDILVAAPTYTKAEPSMLHSGPARSHDSIARPCA